MSARADRARRAARRGRASTLLLVCDLVNVRYLTGYTGSQRRSPWSARGRAAVLHRLPLRRAGGEPRSIPAFDAPAGSAGAARRASTRCSPRGRSGSGSRTPTYRCAAHARLRELLARPGRAGRRRAGSWSGCGRSRSRARSRGSRPPPRSPMPRSSGCSSAGWPGAPSASCRLALEQVMRLRGAATARALTRSSRRARTARCRTRSRATWRSRRGELVVIDWGAELDGYCSDCTRTVAAGEPERAGPRGLRAGAGGADRGRGGGQGRRAAAREVDGAARAVIDGGGLRRASSATGSATASGLEIHEAPRLSQRVRRRARHRQHRHGRAGYLPARASSACGSRTSWR